MRRAQLARAQYDLERAERALQEALALHPHEAGAHHLLAQVHLMRGDSQAAQAPLEAARTRLAAQGSVRLRAAAQGGLRHQFWREFRTNPFAEQALRTALTRPLAEQPRAIAEQLQAEPEHAGSAIALLVALRRTGAWERHRPDPALGPQAPIPARILQCWDTPQIPEDILVTLQSWPQACLGFEHQVFNDASAAVFLQRECAPEVQRAGAAVHPRRAGAGDPPSASSINRAIRFGSSAAPVRCRWPSPSG